MEEGREGGRKGGKEGRERREERVEKKGIHSEGSADQPLYRSVVRVVYGRYMCILTQRNISEYKNKLTLRLSQSSRNWTFIITGFMRPLLTSKSDGRTIFNIL